MLKPLLQRLHRLLDALLQRRWTPELDDTFAAGGHWRASRRVDTAGSRRLLYCQQFIFHLHELNEKLRQLRGFGIQSIYKEEAIWNLNK